MASTLSPSSSSPGQSLSSPPLPHEHQQQQQPLYGRRQESKLLLEAYARCRHHDNKAAASTMTTPECVLITGASGMGKTTLVQRVLRPKVLSDGGLFLSGKFEVSPHYQPYEVIASTLAQLADQLLLVPGDDRLEEIQIALSETLGDEIWMLQDVIPGLERILGCNSVEWNSSSGVDKAITESSSLSRFHFVFCEFCRAVAAMVPLVIFLDDMQWCDQASLELIQALLRPKLAYASSDSTGMPPSSSSLLLIVVSRDDDQEEQHPIHGASSTTLQDGNNHNGNEYPHLSLVDTFLNGSMPSRSITRIHLTSLSKDETRDFLEHNCGFTKETAKVVAPRAFDKCSGNILYTLQYMRSLCKDCELMNNEEKVMDSSHHHHHDDDDETQESVETLILRRIHKLPIFTQELLQMAGCMGNMINEGALAMVTDSTALEISQALETAAKEDLIELVPRRHHYRFIHDSVRQTVFSMIADQEEMAFRIGYQLWKTSWSSSSLLSIPKDADLFTIVNLLNKGVVRFMTDMDERYQVAELNLIAGRRAASKVSFRDASRYCNAGIEFITTVAAAGDCWKDRYDLSLQLYSAAASAELSNHVFTRVYELIEEIFKHARCFQDKLNAHACRIVATGQQGKVADATNMGLAVLEQLGENVPTKTEVEDRPAAFLETERALRGKSNADILSLPHMDDEENLETMRFLVMLIPYTIQAGSSYANWIAARIVHLTLSYGLSRGCAHGFSSYARFVCASNARLGCHYGELAVMIVQKCGNKELMPRVYVSIYAFTSLWTRPLRESLSPLQAAFEVAVENGDVEYALIAAFFRTLFSLYGGMNLVQVEQLLKETRRQLNFYKQDLWLSFTNCALQFVINLTSKTQHPQMLAGDVCSLQDRDFIDNSSVSFVFHGFSSKLAYLFGDFDLADQYAHILRGLSSRVPYTSYWFALNQFQIGLIAVAQVHRGIQPERNVEVAQHCVKKMVCWARDCPDNFLNKKSLLDAELESLYSSGLVDPKVISLYNQAIEGALEEGFLDEAAIACERAGDYMHRNNDTVEARRFWNQAQRLFRRWGATSKAEALKARTFGMMHPDLQ